MHNPAGIGLHEACNRPQHGGLAAARGAEEHGPQLGQIECDVELERSDAMLHLHAKDAIGLVSGRANRAGHRAG